MGNCLCLWMWIWRLLITELKYRTIFVLWGWYGVVKRHLLGRQYVWKTHGQYRKYILQWEKVTFYSLKKDLGSWVVWVWLTELLESNESKQEWHELRGTDWLRRQWKSHKSIIAQWLLHFCPLIYLFCLLISIFFPSAEALTQDFIPAQQELSNWASFLAPLSASFC